MRQPNDSIQRLFHVIDSRDGRILRRCVTYSGANRIAERFNQEYGAVRYSVSYDIHLATRRFTVVMEASNVN